jgi:hypothetical protein
MHLPAQRDIARGPELECAAIQDVLVTTKGTTVQDDAAMKAIRHRIIAMLTPDDDEMRWCRRARRRV